MEYTNIKVINFEDVSKQLSDGIIGTKLTAIPKTMTKQVNECIFSDLVQLAHDGFYRLVLVVGPSGAGKTEILKQLEIDHGYSYINLNLELSSKLIDLTEKQRGMQVKPLFADILDSINGTVLLDNIEILFDSALQQNPLLLLQGLSRNRTLVVSWNGSIKDNSLTYAEPGHPEFRKYACKDFLYIDINAD